MATLTKDLPPFSSNEDDSLKRNTDCVYFLASPLTCKKGNDCEFRHSESARNNPRDCWYWLNGSCLNPKCAFRHPPLDGLVPPQAASITGPSPPVPPSAPPVVTKQAVPCIFFQQGFCLKGDRCPYLHGPVPVSKTKIWPNPATNPATEAPVLKKTFRGPEKFAQPKMGFHLTAPKAVEASRRPQPQGTPKVATARLIQETPRYKETAPPVDSVSLRSRTTRPHHASLVDGKNNHYRREVDDSLRESSPGFDVLVDDKLRKDEYYDEEENYVNMRGRVGIRTEEVDMGHHGHHNSMPDVDLDNYRSKRGYNSYNGSQDEYARAQRGASSERPTGHDRRDPYKSESSDFIQNSSDLRHRLSKQRRGNGLRSVVSPEYKPDYLPEDRGYRSSQSDARSPVHDRPVSSRLQGRIKLPRRSPPLSGAEMYLERDNEKGRNMRRSSPSRPQISSHQGRFRDRLSGRVHDESNEHRIVRNRMGNDSTIKTYGVELVVPRKLSEIRGANRIDKPQQLAGQQSVSGGKLRDTALASSLVTDSAISFDGPKPLSEILKRKRNAGTIASTNVVNFDDKEDSDVNLTSSATNSAADTGKQVQSQGDLQVNKNTLTAEGDEEEGEISNKKVKLIEDECSLPNDEKHPEEEGDLFGGDGEEHEVDEVYDQGDGEYDYEQEDDVEGYNFNEEEIDEGDALGGVDNEDFMDEDDGDDFAKKLGVSF